MKRKAIFKMLVLSFVFFITGCDKYLDMKPDATLVIPSTLEDLQAILDDNLIMNLQTTPALGESTADDYFLPQEAYSSRDQERREFYLWGPYEFRGIGNDWGKGYQAIYNTNLVLELLQSLNRTKQIDLEYDKIRGTALFFRAFYFLGLTTQYGLAFDESTSDRELGVVLRLTSDFNQPSVRATVGECYTQVLRDLNEAATLLPDYPEHLMRPSKGAAHALLARTHLYMRNYPKSMEHAEKALAFNDNLIDFNDLNVQASAPFLQLNKETIFYATANGSVIYTTNIGAVDTVLYNSYHDSDLRKVAFFRRANGNTYFKGNYTGSATGVFGGISTNELYLTLAESKAFQGDVEGSMIVLNTLLKTRWQKNMPFIPVSASNKNDALAIIRTERRKELCFRNLRWADIKRYNKEGANIVLKRNVDGRIYELLPNDPFYALPIPKAIIDLTGIPQN